MKTVKFIAEVSSNHNRDIDRCLAFIDTAADIGCYGIKFQLFKIDQLFAPEILAQSAEHRRRKEWELPVHFLPELAGRCLVRGLKFGCTPFYLDAVEELLPFVDFYKIASYELLWGDLLAACAKTGKPVILSTGMATMQEVRQAVEVLRRFKSNDVTLLHCVSSYPTPVNECNLAVIETMRKEFSTPIGWSDHSVSPAVVKRAVHRWQALMVEFHLDLDGEGEEFAAGHCWLPEQIKSVVTEIKSGFLADGNDKIGAASSENQDRDWRADPVDGLRPLRHMRDGFNNE